MRRVLQGVIVGAVAMLPACGDSSQGSADPLGPSPPAPDVMTITIVRQDGARSFSPNPAPAGGQLVVFRNTDQLVHRVRLNDTDTDTGDLLPGVTSRAVQMPAGGAHYHCPLHPDMVGTVNAASGAPPPPCEGPYCGDD